MGKQEIYVVSTEEQAGKTVVMIGLALKARNLGRKVGYFKPIGLGSTVTAEGAIIDDDVETMKEILELEYANETLCPITLGRVEFLAEYKRADMSKYLARITESHAKASEDKDLVLIEGPPSLSIGFSLWSPVPKLAAEFGANILLVAWFRNDFIVDEVLQIQDYCAKWDVSLLGVILNRVPKDRMAEVENGIKPFLQDRGVKVLGVIPEDDLLSSLTAQEVHQAIGGRIIAGKDGMGNIIRTFLVGAMTPESATRYFQKATDELVITGGDRTDIIFAALETGASAIILTGNLQPSVKILPRADDLAVPMIVVPYDTYTTLQLVQKIVGRIKPGDKRRLDIAREILDKYVDWNQILRKSSERRIGERS